MEKEKRMEEIEKEIGELMKVPPHKRTKEDEEKFIKLSLEGVVIRVTKGLKKEKNENS